MRKHLVVALAGALSVTTVSAPAARATYEILVQPGDTMQSISQRAYGDANHSMAIAQANHLSPAEQLVPGTLLLLPGDGAPLTALSSIIAAPARVGVLAPPAPSVPDASGAAPAPPAAMPLPVLTGPPSPDGAPAPGALQDALAAGPVIQSGLATWYGPGFTGGVTYCGEVYDQWALTAASNTLPCGTVIVVSNPSTGLAVRVRITDRGGFGGSVILDLSRAAFLTIAPASTGVIPVTVALALP